MNPRLRLQLVDALRRCPCMAERARREVVVQQLPPDLADNITRSDATNYDVVNIVSTCEVYANGLKSLVERVRFFDAGSDPFLELEKVWGYISQVIQINNPRLAELALLVGREPFDASLKTLFERTLGEYRLSYTQDISDTWMAVQALWDFPQQEAALQPVQLFIERLAHHLSSVKHAHAQAQPLWDWNESEAGNFNTAPGALTQRRQQITQGLDQVSAAEPPALLVVLEPDPTNSATQRRYKFRVFLWEFYGPAGQRQVHTEENFKAVEHITETLKQLAESTPYNAIRFEFFLGLKYLSETVDQFSYQDSFGNPLKLGELYPLVLRTLERAQRPRENLDWPRRWQLFRKRQTQVVSELEVSDEPRALYNALRSEAMKDVAIVCLSMPGGCRPIEAKHIGQLLGAGTPVVLWPRACAPEETPPLETQDIVETLAAVPDPEELPQLVFQKRQQAQQPNHPGNHLALLWDDPDRLPADLDSSLAARLQTP